MKLYYIEVVSKNYKYKGDGVIDLTHEVMYYYRIEETIKFVVVLKDATMFTDKRDAKAILKLIKHAENSKNYKIKIRRFKNE